MKLGEIIANFRAEKDLSLGDFAKLTNLSKTYIAMLEKGINPSTEKEIVPSIQTLQTCASVMGITLDELVNKLDDDQKININDNITKQDTKNAISFYTKAFDKAINSNKTFDNAVTTAAALPFFGLIGAAIFSAAKNKIDKDINGNVEKEIAMYLKQALTYLDMRYKSQGQNISAEITADRELLRSSILTALRLAEKISRENDSAKN